MLLHTSRVCMGRTLSKQPFMLPHERQRFSSSEDSISTKAIKDSSQLVRSSPRYGVCTYS